MDRAESLAEGCHAIHVDQRCFEGVELQRVRSESRLRPQFSVLSLGQSSMFQQFRIVLLVGLLVLFIALAKKE